MQTGLEASSSSTACNFSMKVLSLVCLGFGGGGGPMGTTSALMCLMAGVVTFSAWLKDARTLKNKQEGSEREREKSRGRGAHENKDSVKYINLIRFHAISNEANRMLLRLPKVGNLIKMALGQY